jgi:hypothetical protein
MTRENYALNKVSTLSMAGTPLFRSSAVQRYTLNHNKHKVTIQRKIDKVKVNGSGDAINDQ